MNKLKHLYLNNISFDKKNKIKINLNNLKYLDLRIKEQDGDDEDCEFDNDNNKAGFNKEKTLEYLIAIFDLQFLSIFNINKNNKRNTKNYKKISKYLRNYLIKNIWKTMNILISKFCMNITQ